MGSGLGAAAGPVPSRCGAARRSAPREDAPRVTAALILSPISSPAVGKGGGGATGSGDGSGLMSRSAQTHPDRDLDHAAPLALSCSSHLVNKVWPALCQ